MIPIQSRRARIAAVATAGVTALTLTFAAGVAYAADQRLEEADGALEKAAALLEASQADGLSEKQQQKFQRQVDRAIELVERAREKVAAAQTTADNP